VILAQDSATASECVMVKSTGQLMLTQGVQGEAEAARQVQCDELVLAEYSAAASKGIGLELSGPPIFAERPQDHPQDMG
jgi:hypothetical protein